eukprot:6482635-Amphidinium_carterae.1
MTPYRAIHWSIFPGMILGAKDATWSGVRCQRPTISANRNIALRTQWRNKARKRWRCRYKDALSFAFHTGLALPRQKHKGYTSRMKKSCLTTGLHPLRACSVEQHPEDLLSLASTCGCTHDLPSKQEC